MSRCARRSCNGCAPLVPFTVAPVALVASFKMPPELQHIDDDSGARCVHCGAPAAGPCASCRAPVCGNCSTLTEGGVRVWAICLACDRKGGRSLSGAWASLALWLTALLVALALVTWLLGKIVSPR
jgi:hypothetical protein